MSPYIKYRYPLPVLILAKSLFCKQWAFLNLYGGETACSQKIDFDCYIYPRENKLENQGVQHRIIDIKVGNVPE